MTAKRRLKKISAKQAAIVMDKSEGQARRDFTELREELGKKERQAITVWEFCQAFKYDIDDVYEILEWEEEPRRSRR